MAESSINAEDAEELLEDAEEGRSGWFRLSMEASLGRRAENYINAKGAKGAKGREGKAKD